MADARQSRTDEIIPPRIAAAAGIMLLLTLVLTAWSSFVSRPDAIQPAGAVVAERDIAFVQLGQGPSAPLVLTDAETGDEIARYAGDEGGVVRGLTRVLAYQRSLRRQPQETPFRLKAHADGNVLVEDLSSGRLININAFGPASAKDFRALF